MKLQRNEKRIVRFAEACKRCDVRGAVRVKRLFPLIYDLEFAEKLFTRKSFANICGESEFYIKLFQVQTFDEDKMIIIRSNWWVAVWNCCTTKLPAWRMKVKDDEVSIRTLLDCAF